MRLPFLGVEVSRAPRPSTAAVPVERSYAASTLPIRLMAQVDPSTSVAGMDGPSNWADLTYGGTDPNPALSGRAKYEVWAEMRASDPAVKSALWLYKLPIRQARYRVEPASGDGIDELIAEAVRWQFGIEGREGRLDLSWDGSLQQALQMLDWGAMGEELIWAREVEKWSAPGAGETARLVRPLERLAPRFPSSVAEVAIDKVTGRIDYVQQDIAGAEPIPGEKMIWYVLDPDGQGPFGVSLLRAMYGSWRMKKALMVANGIAWDRWTVGIPVVRYPQSGGESAKRDAESIGRSVRAHERAYVALEGGAPPAGDWDFGIETATIQDAVPMLRWYDSQIALASLTMFSGLGTTERGSRAVGDTLIEPFQLALSAVAKGIIDERRRRAVRRFVDVNFGTEYASPRIAVSRIGGRPIAQTISSIAQLSSAGFNFTDRETQNDVRDLLELERLPEPVAGAITALPDDIGVAMDAYAPAEGDDLRTAELEDAVVATSVRAVAGALRHALRGGR